GRNWRMVCGLFAAALALAGSISVSRATPPADCKFGQRVTYQRSNYGLIVSGRDGLCLVRSVDGTVFNWLPLAELSVAVDPPLPTDATGPGASPGAASGDQPAASLSAPAGPATILRPGGGAPLVYRAERGQVLLQAQVNGAP